jgi:hypothetical protein
MYRPGSPNVAVKLFRDDIRISDALERLPNSKCRGHCSKTWNKFHSDSNGSDFTYMLWKK